MMRTGRSCRLTTSAGCPQLCEAEALALIAKVENKKLERLQNETATTMDRVQVAAMQMDRRWIDYLRSYVKQDNLEDGVRSLRGFTFLEGSSGRMFRWPCSRREFYETDGRS